LTCEDLFVRTEDFPSTCEGTLDSVMFSRSCTRDTHWVGRLGQKVINIHIFDGSARTGRWGALPELMIVQSPPQSRTFSAPGLIASWLLDGVWTWTHALSTPEGLSTSSRCGRSREVIGRDHPVGKVSVFSYGVAVTNQRKNSASTRLATNLLGLDGTQPLLGGNYYLDLDSKSVGGIHQ
jgi:hypothetical protein